MKTTNDDPDGMHGKPSHILQGKNIDRATLAAIAQRAMIERGMDPDFPPTEK